MTYLPAMALVNLSFTGGWLLKRCLLRRSFTKPCHS